MNINRRYLRHTIGSRVVRRNGTKMNGSQFKPHKLRPKTIMKHLVAEAKANRS